MSSFNFHLRVVCFTALASTLSACGGGGESSSAAAAPSAISPTNDVGRTPDPNATDKCSKVNTSYLFSQNFESFSLGSLTLDDEKNFKNEFCIPVRYVNGFGSDAEPALSTLSGKELSDRLAREKAGQFNGASSTVRVAIDFSAAALGSKSLRVLYPRGTNTSSHSGAQFEMVIPGVKTYNSKTKTISDGEAHSELYLNYKVKFADNFDFAFGGKLPGMLANLSAGDPAEDDEVSARIMWRANGKLEFYLHTKHDARERLLWNNVAGQGHAAVTRNVWHNIQIRMKLNTPGVADGVWQGWLDGKLVADYRDLKFRALPAVHIHSVFFSTFHGGSSGSAGPGEIWWPSQDSQAWFDNFDVSKSPITP